MLILPHSLPQPPKPAVALYGPPAPALKGIPNRSASFSLTHASRMALREMPGAVVVVEEDGPEALSTQTLGKSFFRGQLRLLTKKDFPIFPTTPPMPRWMDPSVTMSGGNVVGQVFPLGWGY